MSSTIVITPPPPDDGEGDRSVARPKSRIASITLEIEDGTSAQDSGHEVTRALKAVEHFNGE